MELKKKMSLLAIPYMKDPNETSVHSSSGTLFIRSRPLNLFLTSPSYQKESESHSVVSDSLRPHGPYSPWNSPGQNTGVGSLSLLQGIFPAQGLNLGLRIAGGFFTS